MMDDSVESEIIILITLCIKIDVFNFPTDPSNDNGHKGTNNAPFKKRFYLYIPRDFENASS